MVSSAITFACPNGSLAWAAEHTSKADDKQLAEPLASEISYRPGHWQDSTRCWHVPQRVTFHRPAAMRLFASAHASAVSQIAFRWLPAWLPANSLMGFTVLTVSPG